MEGGGRSTGRVQCMLDDGLLLLLLLDDLLNGCGLLDDGCCRLDLDLL